MAHSPPISPTVATPLAHRKRRHSEMARGVVIDLTGDDDEGPNSNVAASPTLVKSNSNGTSVDRNLEDNEFEEHGGDDQDLFEDILDTAELEPYRPGNKPRTSGPLMADTKVATVIEDEPSLKPEVVAELRSRLLKIGPDQFLRETISSGALTPAMLGTAFGLDPDYVNALGEDMYIRILGLAIIRAYNKRQKLSQYNTMDDAAELLRKSNNIIVITGAGISTSLGIPDFRSKGTGFYSKLQAKGINEPEEVFDIYEFDTDPSTFYELAHGILPDEKRHSPTHEFIRLLQDKGKLQTNYTQNIDNIEERAGIDPQRLIQCHGSFATATCRKCGFNVKGTEIFPDIRARRVSRCRRCQEAITSAEAAPKKKLKPTSHRYHNDDDNDSSVDDDIPEAGVMKPDITFFGERLPEDFFSRFTDQDVKTVDLVLVIGTSLKVAPVSEMPNYLPHGVPHVYISREPIEHVNFDVQLLGNCDDVVFELCRRAGWELKHEMIPAGLQVKVEGVEGYTYRWDVQLVKGELHGGVAVTGAEEA